MTQSKVVIFSRPFLKSFAPVMAGAATSQRTAAVPTMAPCVARLSISGEPRSRKRLAALQHQDPHVCRPHLQGVHGAISALPIVAFREYQSCVAKRSRLTRVAEWLRREALIATIGRSRARFWVEGASFCREFLQHQHSHVNRPHPQGYLAHKKPQPRRTLQ